MQQTSPRLENDRIVLGKGTVLARRVAVQGCWAIDQPSPAELSALLSLAYGKQMPSVIKAIAEASRRLMGHPAQAANMLADLPEPLEDCDATLAKAQELLEQGTKPFALAKALRRAHLHFPPSPAYSETLRLTDKGVVLGKGTVIAALQDRPEGGTGLAIDGKEPRILALLSLARQELVDEDKVLGCLATASRALQKGDTALAAIAISHLGQPRLEDERLAKRLGIASIKLAGGVHPSDLMKAYGLRVRRGDVQPDWLWKIDLHHYPAGSKQGGQFAPKDGSDAAMSPEQKKAELDKLSDVHDKALLAAHTYGEGTPLPPGYRQIDPETPEGKAELDKLGITKDDLSPPNSSLHAELFVKDGQYVLAFRGTRPSESQDVANDVEQGLGFKGEAYDNAVELAKKIADRTNGNLSFTGHSLGGGLASAAAVVTGLSATTFNAAGIDTASIKGQSSTSPKVDAYYVGGEPLSAIQDNNSVSVPIALAALQAIPIVGDAVAATVIGQAAQGHAILPQAYGSRHELPASKPSGSIGDYYVNRHSMDWVVSGIEARQQQLQKK